MRHEPVVFVLAILWTALTPLSIVPDGVAAQGEARAPRFRLTVGAVELAVTVTTPDGNRIDSLAAEDFEVRDNGESQAISFFATDRVPLDLAIVFDISASMHTILPMAREAAKGLLETLRAGDRAVVLGVGTRISVLAPLTHDLTAAMRGMAGATAAGDTALYDALYIAMGDLQPSRDPGANVRRRVIAVLSDGLDTASHVTFEDAMTAARASAVAIYSIALPLEPKTGPSSFDNLNGPEARYVMRAFASETGGRAFVIENMTDLPTVYAEIADELANQYTLAYVPAQADVRGYRSIAVSIPGRPDLRIRHRAGYQVSRSPL